MSIYFSAASFQARIPVAATPQFGSRQPANPPRFGALNPMIPTLFTDCDGTWGKDLDAPMSPERRELQRYVSQLRRNGQLQVVYITARPAPRVMSIDGLMEPDYTVTENGSFIYEGLPTSGKQPDEGWNNYLLEQIKNDNFETRIIEEEMQALARQKRFGFTLQTIGDLFGAENEQHSPFQATRVLPNDQIKNDRQFELFKSELGKRLTRRGVKRFVINSYPYHGKPLTMIDVMTPAANKGDALRYLKSKFRLKEHMVTVAGDGGNDGFLLQHGGLQPQDELMGGILSERHALIAGGNEKLRGQTDEQMSIGHKILSDPEEDPSSALMKGIRHFLGAMQWADYYDGKGNYEYVRAQLERDLAAR